MDMLMQIVGNWTLNQWIGIWEDDCFTVTSVRVIEYLVDWLIWSPGPGQGASSQYSQYQQGQGQAYSSYRSSQAAPGAQTQRPYAYEQVQLQLPPTPRFEEDGAVQPNIG